MKTLKIYSSEERMPKNKEMVLLFKEEQSLGISQQDIHFCQIRYNLEEIDPETGHWTGVSYSYRG